MVLATGKPITQRLRCMLGLTNTCVDRAEHSKRQDWSLEAAYDIFPLLDPLLAYTVKTLLDKSNILRDSVLMQAECLHFEAYVHVYRFLLLCCRFNTFFKALLVTTRNEEL
jgi:hypothetical protein